ncbi:hypothetical protein A9490_24745 [Bacillus thuringiensis]|uniref:DNA primase family protein n=1 Tax=Bacillus thuringiensis TaxID=1428 RepID=UPI0008FE3AD7|nr:phage/plasmid primase, P4 family [Bacillus thuringiensis]OJE31221.1 hypothetical protein A9490_24745 [Bacillus thuringiensis]
MKSTSDKTILTVVKGIKKDDSSKEVSAQTFDKSSISKHSINSINEMQTENQDEKNDYMSINFSKHGKVTYDIDVYRLSQVIMKEYPILNNGETLALFNKELGVWEDRATNRLKQIITNKLSEAFNRNIRNETLELIKDKIYENREISFNNNHRAVTFKNGTFYFPKSKGERGHFIEGFNKDDYSTIKIPHNFNQEAWKKFIVPERTLEKLSPLMDEQEKILLLEMIGSLFYKRQNPRGIFIMVGSGKNGKSVIGKMLNKIIGKDNTSSTSLKSLIDDKFSRVSLMNKALNFCGDIDASYFNESGDFKALTGDDVVRVEFKGENSFDFLNRARLVFSANKLPKFKDDTEAITSRMNFINMPYKPDYDEVEELIQSYEEEIEILITCAINMFTGVLEKDEWTIPDASKELKEKWISNSNSVMKFIDECCVLGSDSDWGAKKTFDAYKDFCIENGYEQFNRNNFKEKFETVVGEPKKTNKGMVYKNLEVLDPR